MKLFTMPKLATGRCRRPAALLAVTLLGGAVVFALSRSRTPVYPGAHSAQIYRPGASTGPLYPPFQLAIDPMERLLLINFEGDPDEVYLGFEPQVFDDAIHGQGLLVIGWRIDGKVDVFHQPGLRLDPATYAIAGGGLNELVERPLTGAYFEVHETGVAAEITFTDLLERPVSIRVHERSSKLRKPFGLLAPMGSAATAPSALPLVLLRDFSFVRRAGSEVRVAIDGREHAVDRLPIPIERQSVYFVRYARSPLIARLNPAHDGPVATLDAGRSGTQVLPEAVGETRVEVRHLGGAAAIARLERRSAGQSVRLDLDPPFPNLLDLADGADLAGAFTITSDPSLGRVAGTYRASRSGDAVRIAMTPSGGWRPAERRWSIRLVYAVAPVFRRWPTTYAWSAELDLTAGVDAPTMRSRWERPVS
jgi:hypothetical protein